jgi:acyl carrier protein
MSDSSNSPLTRLVVELLAERGDHAPVTGADSLFLSGRLDSLAATQVMMMLETEYGIDLADADFDITRLDTLDELRLLTREAA